MDKTELLESLEDSRLDMLELVEDLPEEVMLEPGVIGEWSIKDTLAHMAYWEGQLVTLLFQVSQGQAKPSTLHFGKESVDEINARWQAAAKERTLDQVWQDWSGVRKQTIRRASGFSDAELNKVYPWGKGMPLWEWIENDSYGHEGEHGDEIRTWLKLHYPDSLIELDDDNSMPTSNGHQK